MCTVSPNYYGPPKIAQIQPSTYALDHEYYKGLTRQHELDNGIPGIDRSAFKHLDLEVGMICTLCPNCAILKAFILVMLDMPFEAST